MSDTPRTDAEFEYVKYGSVDFKSNSEEIAAFARQLERELNAANERIKRLEEALVEIQAAMIRPASNHRLMQIAGPARQVINIVKLTNEAKP